MHCYSVNIVRFLWECFWSFPLEGSPEPDIRDLDVFPCSGPVSSLENFFKDTDRVLLFPDENLSVYTCCLSYKTGTRLCIPLTSSLEFLEILPLPPPSVAQSSSHRNYFQSLLHVFFLLVRYLGPPFQPLFISQKPTHCWTQLEHSFLIHSTPLHFSLHLVPVLALIESKTIYLCL